MKTDYIGKNHSTAKKIFNEPYYVPSTDLGTGKSGG